MTIFRLILLITTIAASVCAQTSEQGSEETSSNFPHLGYDIKVLDNCGLAGSNRPPIGITILNSAINTLDGWSHINKGKEFRNLKLSPDKYLISKRNHLPDKSCNHTKTQSAILVKKLANWDRQHANGIETTFKTQPTPLKDIYKIIIDLKLHKEQTFIPTTADIYSSYHSLLSKDELGLLDKAKANLSITLFETPTSDDQNGTIETEQFIEIDQLEYFDTWIRLTIFVNQMDTYSKQGYRRTDINPQDYQNTLISGIRINPENNSGKVVRNFLLASWTPDTPELFKEMHYSFKSIYIVTKQ